MEETKKRFDRKNFTKRFFSGAVLVILFGTAGYFGGWYWYGLIALISAFALFEFYRVYGIHNKILGVFGYIASAVFLYFEAVGNLDMQIAALIGGFLLITSAYVFTYPKYDSTKMLAAIFGVIYTVVLLSYMYRIRMLPDGNMLIWLIFIASWGTDVFAYTFGILFGKHKMTPVLSPKKSVEGAIGGVLGATALGALYAAVFGKYFTEVTNPYVACMVLCAAAGLISMSGDLLASAFKREHGIKDYSNVIPGHGGILDRFDSVIFVAPIIFYVAFFFVH